MKHLFRNVCSLVPCCAVSLVALAASAEPLAVVDLGSDSAWRLSVDGGPNRPIRVTAGGWNSDQQDPQIPSASVKDHVVYERAIVVPEAADGNVVKVEFGGCNYGAEVFLDDLKITEHHAPMTPFEADLTGLVEPGKRHALRVKAYTRFHYGAFGKPTTVTAGFDFNRGMSPFTRFDGHSKFAYGLTGYVRLVLYPPVYIRNVFVRTYVESKTLEYDVWITNSSTDSRTVGLESALASWGENTFHYPDLPKRRTRIGAGETCKVSVKDIDWNLGAESYWWPNIPFREDYTTVLHWLNLTIEEDGKTVDRERKRFGFVEYGEGPYYYTVNGVRFTSIGDSNSYGQVGEYDCWTETACFLPPDGTYGGCPETWKRYQRIGFNSMRLSTSVPTRYMLETADEAGFMLIPEGGSWGNNTCTFAKDAFSRQLQGMMRVCRGYPSVARYSMANESISGDGGPWRWLIDAAVETDPTRPYVFEIHGNRGTGRIKGMESGHAYRMQHYDPIVQGGDFIRGMGEYSWSVDGIAPFGLAAREFRLRNWAHFAPWSWLNFWPNFLEGMSHERHPWKHDNHADRIDGVDGWGSPVIAYAQRSLHPYLAIDRENFHAGYDEVGLGLFADRPTYLPGERIERSITVFNGGLANASMQLRWGARCDSPEGPVVAPLETVGPFTVEPGFHATTTIAFTAPALETREKERLICMTLESLKDGQVVFHEDTMALRIAHEKWQWVDDGDATVSYSAGWEICRGNSSYKDTEHYSDESGSSVTFTFTGTKAKFRGCKRNDLGIAQIFVDGEDMGTIDFYQASGEYAIVYETPALPPGEHRVEIRVTGQKNEASRAKYVIIDAFKFL